MRWLLETLAQAIEAEESLCCYKMDVSCAPRFIEFELDDEEDCTYNEEEYDPEEEPFDEDDCPPAVDPTDTAILPALSDLQSVNSWLTTLTNA